MDSNESKSLHVRIKVVRVKKRSKSSDTSNMIRESRGTSEPPVSSDATTSSSCESLYHETTGLRRAARNLPIKIAGVSMGSQDSLNSVEDFPVFHWERVRHRSASGSSKTLEKKLKEAEAESFLSPFGRISSSSRPSYGLGNRRKAVGKKSGSSSVSNIIAALESEISSGFQGQRHFSGTETENVLQSSTSTRRSSVDFYASEESSKVNMSTSQKLESNSFFTEGISCIPDVVQSSTVQQETSGMTTLSTYEKSSEDTSSGLKRELFSTKGEDFVEKYSCEESKQSYYSAESTFKHSVSHDYSSSFNNDFEDAIEVDPSQVRYHEAKEINDPIRTEAQEETVGSRGVVEDNMTVSKKESLAFEDLFEKLGDEESGDEGDLVVKQETHCHESISTAHTNSEKVSKEENSEFFVKNEATDSSNPVQMHDSLKETSEKESKLTAKRLRNRTIDYHDLDHTVRLNNYNGQVAKYVQKTYLPVSETSASNQTGNIANCKSKTEDDGIGHGLGIILDKLRNIETKLDEIKTMEQSIWYPDIEMDKNMPVVGDTPSQSEIEIKDKEDKCCNTSWQDDHHLDDTNSDVTLIVPEDEADDAKYAISDGADTPRNQDIEKVLTQCKKDNDTKAPEITVSEPCSSDNDSTEDPEERKERIEKLAQKLASQDLGLNLPKPVECNDVLETLSEQSEEDEATRGMSTTSSSRRKQSRRRNSSKMRRRTRSASRDRSLAKIKFCWRCHQTGHESFDCQAQLHPGNWCPRCLETSHWEDDCWVSEKQVFCTICTLPGHLPCVHDTTDFRQRKLVVETFGWLAFKDWFREPDFWSWWNISGYTNVPLYKLMQHHCS